MQSFKEKIEELEKFEYNDDINVDEYKKLLQEFFPKDLFRIDVEDNEFTVVSTNENLCVKFKIFELPNNKKYLYSLETSKCLIPGKEVISKIISFAEKYDFYAYSLSDISNINPSCSSPYHGVEFDLAVLNILSNGESWYNSFGFYSKYYDEEKRTNEQFRNQTFANFEHLILDKLSELQNKLKQLNIDFKSNTFSNTEHRNKFQEFSNTETRMYKLEELYSNFKVLIGLSNFEIDKILGPSKDSLTSIANIKLKDFFKEIQNSMRQVTDFCNFKYKTLSLLLKNIKSLKNLGFLYYSDPERLVKFFSSRNSTIDLPSAKKARFSAEKFGGKKRKTRRRKYQR